MKNNKKNKLAYGGSAMDVESPMQALFDIIRNSEESAFEASNDPTVAGMKMLGKTLKNTGASMAGQGLSQSGDMSGLGGFMQDNWSNVSKGVSMFAFGGQVPSEIEGEEAVELPNGEVFEAKGASHEQGGIDMLLPGGSEVFSKRIKVDGVSIADRKKKRVYKEFTLEELLKSNESDGLVKNSLKRTKQNNEKEEQLDNNIQKVVGSVLNPPAEKFAYGGPTPSGNPLMDILMQGLNGLQNNQYGGFGSDAVSKGGDIEEVVLTPGLKPVNTKSAGIITKDPTISATPINSTVPTGEEEGFDWSSILSGLDTGDLGNAIGMTGNVYSAFAPMNNTLKNRAGDTPNINPYKDFGKDGLAKLDESEQYIDMMKNEALQDLQLSKSGTVNRNNNSARGINTLRALNLATDAQFSNAKSDVLASSAGQMMQLLGQEAQMENQQDQMVMKGEESRDLADRMDRDNFFSNMAEDISTKGRGIQQIGKDVNQTKQNDVAMNLINQLSQYGITVDKKGNLGYKQPKETKASTTETKKTDEYVDNGVYNFNGETFTKEDIQKAMAELMSGKFKKKK